MVIKKKNGSQGFSLVELMIVVAIIGVLAALAVPKFQTFQAKARQSEAKTNVSHIFTLEQSYYGANDQFTGLGATGNNLAGATGGATCPVNTLGFNPQPCTAPKLRYQYSAATGTAGTTFTASAISGTAANNQIMPGCTVADQWNIDESKNLYSKSDATALCQ